MYDLLIIGGGPSGVAAGVYAARKRLKTLLITEEIGGQSVVSDGIENWIGSPKVSGADLAKLFSTHLDAVKGDIVTLALHERVESLTSVGGETAKQLGGFTAKTKSGKEFTAKAVLIATGAGRRKLDIPGAEKFENKGVTYCASCDGPLFPEWMSRSSAAAMPALKRRSSSSRMRSPLRSFIGTKTSKPTR